MSVRPVSESPSVPVGDYWRAARMLVGRPWFILPVVAVATLAFGYATVHRTISVDDLGREHYIGSGHLMLAGGRFGFLLWQLITSGTEFVPFGDDLVAVVLLVAASIAFAALWWRETSGRVGRAGVTLFAALFVSYPLINEIWEYTLAAVALAGGWLFVALALALAQRMDGWRRGSLLGATALLLVVVTSYESLASAYLFGILAMLFLRRLGQAGSDERWLRRTALWMTLPLVLAVVGRVVIHRVLLAVTGIPIQSVGQTEIAYLSQGLAALRLAGRRVLSWYVAAGLWYLPIAALVGSVIVSVVLGLFWARRLRSPLIPLLVVGMLGTLVLLTLLQGSATPYRACQVFSLQVGFAAMLAVHTLGLSDRRSGQAVTRCVVGALAFLVLHQGLALNGFLAANHERWAIEQRVVQRIGDDLSAAGLSTKTVVLVGAYPLPAHLARARVVPSTDDWRAGVAARLGLDASAHSRGIVQTNITPVIEWSNGALGGTDLLRELFAREGYDLRFALADHVPRAREIAAAMPAYPAVGYLKDAGDYVIVRLLELPAG